MKFFVMLFFLLLTLTVSGCGGATVKPEKLFSKNDYSKLTLCLGLSYSAHRIASLKIKGEKKAKIKKLIITDKMTKKTKENISKLVDGVYKDKFKSAWDYSVKFFKECAGRVASVYSPRVQYASFCTQNSFIADVAYSFKEQGKDKAEAYKYFDKFKSKVPNNVIDSVYQHAKDRKSARVRIWSGCMKSRVADY